MGLSLQGTLYNKCSLPDTFFACFSDWTEYCEWESFNATCAPDEVIVMRNAKYGRMRLSRCVTKNYGHIGCGTDVMPFMDERCSGRRHCVASVISLHNKRSCPKDFKSYLQAGYDCLKGTDLCNLGHLVLITRASRVRPGESGLHFSVKLNFHINCLISILYYLLSPKCFPKGPVNINPTLVQVSPRRSDIISTNDG